MFHLAFRNLLHDKVRLAITVVGITFAVVLILVQVGMFVGFMRASSAIVDHTVADLWIVSRNSANFDWAAPFPERYVNKVRSTPGVARAETLFFGWAFIRLPHGGTEQVEVVGYHPEAGPGWGEPWGFIQGDVRSVLGGDHVIVDESSSKKLGQVKVGDRLEIMRQEVRVTGITRGIRSLTTAPYLFTTYETARKLADYVGPDDTVFILVQAQPGQDLPALISRLQKRLPHVDVLTREDYSFRTRRYWAIQTGMGFGFLLTAILAFVVGVAVVGQTIYADTMEHLREYATLKAIGAGTKQLVVILWCQAGLAGALGYFLGSMAALALCRFFDALGLMVVIPPVFWGAVAAVTVLMCFGASIVSIRKVRRLDPAVVFRE